jgi:hemoglobin
VADKGVDAASIRAAVDIFYKRLLADPALRGAFDGIDMRRLKAHQLAFMLRAIGGSSLYSGRDMKTAHLGLHITDEQFAATVTHLVGSLREVGVANDVVDRARVDIQALRGLIVGRP